MNSPPPPKLAEVLARRYPTAKRQTLKRMVESGRVRIAGRVATKLSQIVDNADSVDVDERPASPPAIGAFALAPLGLIYEDDDVLVVDKPAGLLTSTVARERRPTALAIVRAYAAARSGRIRIGLIHRLDRDASGLLVFSKSDIAYRSLKTQFFRHTVERVYVATVLGVPNPRKGTIRSRLAERPDGSVKSTHVPGKGQLAITHYEVVSTEAGRSVVRLRLETGRKHQIRVHMAGRGTPIVGDKVYGRAAPGDGALALRAVRLAFDHPRTGRRLTFEADAPGSA